MGALPAPAVQDKGEADTVPFKIAWAEDNRIGTPESTRSTATPPSDIMSAGGTRPASMSSARSTNPPTRKPSHISAAPQAPQVEPPMGSGSGAASSRSSLQPPSKKLELDENE